MSVTGLVLCCQRNHMHDQHICRQSRQGLALQSLHSM